MAGRGHAAERSKRLKDSKRFKLILETTQFDIAQVQQLEGLYTDSVTQHEEASTLRELYTTGGTSRDASLAIDALGFRDYCFGLDSLFEHGEMDQKLSFLLTVYAKTEEEIQREDILEMLRDHIPSLIFTPMETQVYTWMKRNFAMLKGSKQGVFFYEVMELLPRHPQNLLQSLRIVPEKIIERMMENKKRDGIILRSIQLL